jgi:hypothetical protein
MSMKNKIEKNKEYLEKEKRKGNAKKKFNCIVCKKEVIDYPHNRSMYCSAICRYKHHTGKNNPNFNHKWDEQMKEKASKYLKGQFLKGRIVWNKNLTKEDERVLKYVKHLYGNTHGIANKGKKSPWTTKRNLENNPMENEETRLKMGKSLKGMFALEKNPMWKGGLSFEPYTTEWTNKLRSIIRKRDDYTCQTCGEHQGSFLLDVHHIDYNKKNCNPENLISLCKACHSKTNQNRDKWKLDFQKRMDKIS